MEPKKKLNKAAQKAIVSKTHTGGLPANVGYPGFGKRIDIKKS